jgi:hypothetical protein
LISQSKPERYQLYGSGYDVLLWTVALTTPTVSIRPFTAWQFVVHQLYFDSAMNYNFSAVELLAT